ncbi:MAG: TIGR00725 family protein [Deltaproteobacteria bacterium]|nr:TIGR00725 family protein [Deltaproteobacteria bacterium]
MPQNPATPSPPARHRYISVIGAGSPTRAQYEMARELGGLLAQAGFAVVTGGLGGVMEAACRGASEAGGVTLGIIPGSDPAAANPYCQTVVPSGLGQARNVLVVATGLAAVAVGGSTGTLSEIGHALKMGRLVVSLDSWDIPGVHQARDAREAMAIITDNTDTT